MYAESPDLNSSISKNGTSEAWNKKMSSKFQIMNNDYVSGSTNTFTWVDAWKGCKAYTGSSDGGGAQAGQWRLPTQKEYKMISVLYPQLLVQGGISPFAVDYYWSSTESGAKYAWHVYFSHGGVYDGLTKTNLYKVRCIRDL